MASQSLYDRSPGSSGGGSVFCGFRIPLACMQNAHAMFRCEGRCWVCCVCWRTAAVSKPAVPIPSQCAGYVLGPLPSAKSGPKFVWCRSRPKWSARSTPILRCRSLRHPTAAAAASPLCHACCLPPPRSLRRETILTTSGSRRFNSVSSVDLGGGGGAIATTTLHNNPIQCPSINELWICGENAFHVLAPNRACASQWHR